MVSKVKDTIFKLMFIYYIIKNYVNIFEKFTTKENRICL